MFKLKMLFCILLICAALSGISCKREDEPAITRTMDIYLGEHARWLSQQYDFYPTCSCNLDRNRNVAKQLKVKVVREDVSGYDGNKYTYRCEVNIPTVDDKSDGVLRCSIYDENINIESESVRLVLKKRDKVSDEQWHDTKPLDNINEKLNKNPTTKVGAKKADTDSNNKIKHVIITSQSPNVTQTNWLEAEVINITLGKPWTWSFKEMEDIVSCKCYLLNTKGNKRNFGMVQITTLVNEIRTDTCHVKVTEVNDEMNGLIRCEIITKAGGRTIQEALISPNEVHIESSTNGWMVAACILIVSLLVATGILIWFLLRKRCRTMWSPKEHNEQLMNEVVTSQSQDGETIGDTSGKASYAVITPEKPEVKTAVSNKLNTEQKPEELRLNDIERKPATTENLDENKKSETPTAITEVVERNGVQMPVTAVTTNNSTEGKENSRESPANVSSNSGDQVQEPLKTPETKTPDNYQLNMIKNCFGEAISRMNQKKPLIPKKPSRKSLKGASSTESLQDYDKPASILRAVGEPDNAKSSEEKKERPKSVMTQNDLYVSADADEEYDKPASFLRSVLDAGTPNTPLIRPPTAFISEDDIKGGSEEYDTPRSFARPPVATPKLNSSKAADIDNESDPETDDLYDSPSSVLRKLSYPRP